MTLATPNRHKEGPTPRNTGDRASNPQKLPTNSPQTTSRTSNESTQARSYPRRRHSDAVRATSMNRERIGRFDDGMATHPTINRERIGRFDEGIGEDRLAA